MECYHTAMDRQDAARERKLDALGHEFAELLGENPLVAWTTCYDGEIILDLRTKLSSELVGLFDGTEVVFDLCVDGDVVAEGLFAWSTSDTEEITANLASPEALVDAVNNWLEENCEHEIEKAVTCDMI